MHLEKGPLFCKSFCETRPDFRSQPSGKSSRWTVCQTQAVRELYRRATAGNSPLA
jgi:hypothetical protein